MKDNKLSEEEEFYRIKMERLFNQDRPPGKRINIHSPFWRIKMFLKKIFY